jgi:hypothetical protein
MCWKPLTFDLHGHVSIVLRFLGDGVPDIGRGVFVDDETALVELVGRMSRENGVRTAGAVDVTSPVMLLAGVLGVELELLLSAGMRWGWKQKNSEWNSEKFGRKIGEFRIELRSEKWKLTSSSGAKFASRRRTSTTASSARSGHRRKVGW